MRNVFLMIIRALFGLIDSIVVWLIKNLYVLLVQIANTNVFGSFIYQMLGRIYVFLGIFMLFKLTMSMITYVINPDTMSDKNKGFSKLITNVVISLVLIVTVPSIFREAYRLQALILNSNAVYQIVTGEKIANNNVTDVNSDVIKNAEYIGDDIAKGVFSAFVYQDGNVSATTSNVLLPLAGESVNAVNKITCTEGTEQFQKGQCSRNQEVCTTATCMVAVSTVTLDGDGEHGFANEYKFLLSTICGGAVAYFFLVFCLDASVRAIKLGMLQIVAPIPILSMIDPKGGVDKVKKWGSACGKEYAGLFIRLAGVYFAVSIIQLVLGNNSSVSDAMTYYNSDGTFGKQGVGLFVKLFIILGALTFAKQLPKFIEEILGFKLSGGDGFNLKKRLGGMAGLGVAKTLGAGALGFAGGMAANALAAKGNWKGQGLKNGFKNVGSILGGGFSAGARGMTSKEKSMWKSAGGGIKGSVDARNLRDKRGSLGQGGVKGFVTRRADDINRFAGNKTRLDYLEDDLKKLQYGPAGLQDLQDDLFNKQLIASQYNDFQYLKDANGVAFDSNWEADLRNHFGSMVDSSGNPMFSESEINDIVVGAITATGVSNDTATAYLKRLNEKKAADATVRSAQAAVQKQQGAIRDKNIEIDNQKKADAVNKKQ